MKKRQSNYLNMAEAVIKHFDNHIEAWSVQNIVALGINKVRSVVEAIRTAVMKQITNNPVGYTASKEQTRDILESILYQTSLRLRSYAKITANAVLTEKTHFSRYVYDSMNNNEIVLVAQMLADACEEHLPDLAEYQVDQSTVDKLRKLAEETQSQYAQRDIVVDERMEATARLDQLFGQLRQELKTLDDIVEAYVEDDIFVATYFNARRIHDLKGRHAHKEEENGE